MSRCVKYTGKHDIGILFFTYVSAVLPNKSADVQHVIYRIFEILISVEVLLIFREIKVYVKRLRSPEATEVIRSRQCMQYSGWLRRSC